MTSRGLTRSRVSAGAVRSTAAHEAILAAAGEVLRERGYGGFTIEAVARAAQSSKPTIYRWWPNKAALIHELYCRKATQLLQVQDLGSAQAELVSLARRQWALWRDPAVGRAVRGMIAEAQADPAALRQLRDEFMPAQRQLTREVLERAQARGEIPAAADLAAAFEIYKGFTWYRLLTDQISEAEEPAIDGVMALLIRGLQEPADARPATAPGQPGAAAASNRRAPA